MRKNLLSLLAVLPVVSMLTGCHKAQNVTEIAPYLFEVETYKELDPDYADKYWAKNNDNWEGGCSAITKLTSDGTRLIGRNMDLNISENCAYVVRTDAGKYKTMGLQYTFRPDSPTYAEVKKHGISKKWSKLLPYFCDDIMNDAGFHIEVNMRHGEYYPNGDDMFAMSGTNPDGERRVHMFELPRYLAENCATIADAKEYIKKIDIYSKNHYWNYCFVMADSTGAASLLEFCNDDLFETSGIYWLDETPEGLVLEVDGVREKFDASYLDDAPYFGELNYHAIGQTNFFINKYGFLRQDTKSGFGRLQTLQNGIDTVETKQDMYDLINKVSYSNFYLPYDECKANHFDPRSEQVGEHGPFPLTSPVVMRPEFEDFIKEAMDEYSAPIRAISREEKQAANEFWESTFTEVVDLNAKSIFVRFFENEDMKYELTFDSFKKVESI